MYLSPSRAYHSSRYWICWDKSWDIQLKYPGHWLAESGSSGFALVLQASHQLPSPQDSGYLGYCKIKEENYSTVWAWLAAAFCQDKNRREWRSYKQEDPRWTAFEVTSALWIGSVIFEVWLSLGIWMHNAQFFEVRTADSCFIITLYSDKPSLRLSWFIYCKWKIKSEFYITLCELNIFSLSSKDCAFCWVMIWDMQYHCGFTVIGVNGELCEN